MPDSKYWVDPNGLIVLGATPALSSVVAYAAASITRPDGMPPASWLLPGGLLLTFMGGILLWIGIRRRPKHSDMSVPLVVGVEMILIGGAINWMCYLLHEAYPDGSFFGGLILAGAVILGGVALLCWIIRQKWLPGRDRPQSSASCRNALNCERRLTV